MKDAFIFYASLNKIYQFLTCIEDANVNEIFKPKQPCKPTMEDSFYDSLEEDSFCECYSDLADIEDSVVVSPSGQDEDENLSEIIPLYQRETPKTKLKTLKKEVYTESKRTIYKDPIPKQKRENRTYLNLFYSKIKYPAIGEGDAGRWKDGSETTRAHYDPSSRKSSAVSRGRSEDFSMDKDYSSDESSFYEKFIAEEELKRTAGFKSNSGTISNLLSVSEQCLSKTQLNKPKLKRKVSSKSSSVPSSSPSTAMEDDNLKLKLLRKRQFYGKKVSSRNRAIMEETKRIKKFNTNLKIKQ